MLLQLTDFFKTVTSPLIALAGTILVFTGVIISSVIVMRGWTISHELTIEREIKAKRREQHLNYLVQTYRTLSKVMPHDQTGRLHELNDELQEAIADIQFLGTFEQVQFIQLWVYNMINKIPADLDPLLKSLRDELRDSLGKEKIDFPIWWYHVSPLPKSAE